MPKPNQKDTHFRTCSLCEAMCGLEITLKNGQVQSIKGDKNDPFSKGYICPKATALQDLHDDPDRLRRPIQRTSDGWKEIPWSQAFDLVEKNLKSIQQKHGSDSVGIYFGNPNVHNLGSMLFGPGFARSLRTKYRYSATSVDQLPHHYASQFMFGHMLLIPIPDIDRTDFFLCIGANPVVSNGSLMTAGGMPTRIKELRERGGKMVVIDPRRTETADKADQHLFIKPGTDAYLLASIIYELTRDIPNDLPDYHRGLSELPGLFESFSPEKTATVTGVDPETLKKLAADFSAAKKAVCYGRMGVSTQAHGSLCQWMINLINILTGNFDKEGGALFTKPALDVIKLGRKGTMHKINRWTSRVRKLPEFNGELPVATMAEDILEAGEGKIRGMVTVAGNPVLSTPNGQQLDSALDSLEFMVSIDIYLNETSRHADVIIPTSTGLENDHYDIVFNTLAIHNVAKFSPALFKPRDGLKKDWEVLKELTRRFKKRTWPEKLMWPFINARLMLSQGLKRSGSSITLKKLLQNPHGIDLGPLEPSLPGRLHTPDQKVDLSPEVLVNGLKKLKVPPETANQDLLLIGRRELRSNNSWMHNHERLVKGPERGLFLIHPTDAKSRKIADMEQITVRSRTGQVQVKAHITEEVMPGVVSLPHGYGHGRKGIKWRIAERHAGASINDLTDELGLDSLSGNAAFSAVPVTVSKT